ncbi:MAG: DUF819 family protein [Clostridiales bacterium]|nr:DUF819 family protein [Clostridiales bacterium]
MIHDGFLYFAVLVLFSALLLWLPTWLRGGFWDKFFAFAPPIVLLYIGCMLLSTLNLWNLEETASAYSTLKNDILYSMIFLMLLRCDIRKIIRLGGRMLAGFFAASVSIGIGFIAAYALIHASLGAGAWRSLAALCGSWMGGGGNMLAIQAAYNVSEDQMAFVLVADSICASVWVMFLLWAAGRADKFNRWTSSDTHLIDEVGEKLQKEAELASAPISFKSIMLLFGSAFLVSALSQRAGAAVNALMPFFDKATWTVLIITALGILLALTPFGRLGGVGEISNVLLYSVVALIASRASLSSLIEAPVWILAGFIILIVHGALMLLAAKLLRLDIFTCSVASLANIGGTATAPILAGSYSGALVPIGVLMALMGYVIGTGGGLLVGQVMSFFG